MDLSALLLAVSTPTANTDLIRTDASVTPELWEIRTKAVGRRLVILVQLPSAEPELCATTESLMFSASALQATPEIPTFSV